MGLFNNVTGPGISKNAPKKKPFFRFWELFSNKFWDFFKINLIYFLFCIPIVTIGPATAAMTALMRNICLERPQFLFHDFVKEFKKNFKQAIVVGTADILVTSALVYSSFLFFSLETATISDAVMFSVAPAAALLFFIMNLYIYPQIVTLELGLFDIFKNALVLSLKNILSELIVLIVIGGYVVLVLYFPIFVLPLTPLMPLAWLGFLSVFCCYPAIQKYIINPYYEKTGEKNPELPDYDEDEAIFTDMGGSEAPIDLKNSGRQSNGGKGGKGRIIK